MKSEKVKPRRGQSATRPSQIPFKGWKDIVLRVKKEIAHDNVSLVSAGIAFYFFLALFPTLNAIVSIYGLVTSAQEMQEQLRELLVILPVESHQMISGIMQSIVDQSDQSLGLSFAVSILFSIWSTSKGMSAVFSGINIAYNERDTRGFLRRTGLVLLFTLGGILLIATTMGLIAGGPDIAKKLEFPEWAITAVVWGRWPLLLVMVMTSLGVIYKWVPHRTDPKIIWVNYGAITSGIAWLIASILFSYYVSNFASYDKLYGGFAAVIILLLWFYLSAYMLILGAEINSEMEYQTKKDTTVGPEKEMGERGAYHADHVAPLK